MDGRCCEGAYGNERKMMNVLKSRIIGHTRIRALTAKRYIWVVS